MQEAQIEVLIDLEPDHPGPGTERHVFTHLHAVRREKAEWGAFRSRDALGKLLLVGLDRLKHAAVNSHAPGRRPQHFGDAGNLPAAEAVVEPRFGIIAAPSRA